MSKQWFGVTLFNLFIAACLGVVMRYAFVDEIPWVNFRFVLHGHSHVAMLGWVYLALYTFFIHAFLNKQQQESAYYQKLFWLTQAAVIGMLIFFPLQGYAMGSIAFSTLHILCSYAFTFRFFKDLKRNKDNKLASTRFAKMSLVFMIISTLALWSLGPVIALGKQGSALYYAMIQFFLHFQFNGWFIFAALALFFRLLENKDIQIPAKLLNYFFYTLIVSCFLTYFLAVTWSTPLPILFAINSVGVSIQLIALFIFFFILRQTSSAISQLFSRNCLLLLKVAFLCFSLKIIIQTAVVVPYIGMIGYTIRNFVIGFIHLILLGTISHFIFAFGVESKTLNLNTLQIRTGLIIFFIGFLLSELLLFGQGILLWAAVGFIPFYYEILFGISLLLPLGSLIIWLGNKGNNKT